MSWCLAPTDQQHPCYWLLFGNSLRPIKHICVGNLTLVVKTMACHLVGAKPLSEAMLEYYWFNILEQHSMNSNKNSNSFTQENTFGKVVCEMAAILSRPQYDKWILMFRGAGFQETVKFQCQEIARKWTCIFISFTLNSVKKGQYITRISRLLHTTIFTILVIDSNIIALPECLLIPKCTILHRSDLREATCHIRQFSGKTKWCPRYGMSHIGCERRLSV